MVWLANALLLWLRVELPSNGRWVEALFPLLAVATTPLARAEDCHCKMS